MATKIFVNLPVKSLEKSVAFFTTLGYSFNAQFTDDTAACMIVSDDIHVMLLTEPKFKSFTPKEVADTTRATEVIVCLSHDSREGIDELVKKAIGAGAISHYEPKDYGFMYQSGFQDLDGHLWEYVYLVCGETPQ